MNQTKKAILQEQISKLEDVLHALEANFDLEEELSDEYSFLSIVKEKMDNIIKSDSDK